MEIGSSVFFLSATVTFAAALSESFSSSSNESSSSPLLVPVAPDAPELAGPDFASSAGPLAAGFLAAAAGPLLAFLAAAAVLAVITAYVVLANSLAADSDAILQLSSNYKLSILCSSAVTFSSNASDVFSVALSSTAFSLLVSSLLLHFLYSSFVFLLHNKDLPKIARLLYAFY